MSTDLRHLLQTLVDNAPDPAGFDKGLPGYRDAWVAAKAALIVDNCQAGLHIAIIGNPVDGFKYIGPFKTRDDAIAWADRDVSGTGDWWIAPLEAKDAYQEPDAFADDLMLTIIDKHGKQQGTILLSNWLAEARDSHTLDELAVIETLLRRGTPYRVDMNLGDWIDLRPAPRLP